MGTSVARPRPSGNQWAKAARDYQRWQTDGAAANRAPATAVALQDALRTHAAKDHNVFGLHSAMHDGGDRLIDSLLRLQQEGPSDLPDAADAEHRRIVFTRSFVDAIASGGGTYADAAVRSAAVEAAERLLADDAVRQAVEAGARSGLPISSTLFCTLYRLFFADTVRQFLTTVIAEHVDVLLTAHLPILPAVDPQGQIGQWLAANIVAALPNPCAQQGDADGPSVAELGRSMLKETVDRALGLTLTDGTS